MRVHVLKIEPIWFKDVMNKKKNFEIRKNDRDFKVGDYVVLWEFFNDRFTKRFLVRRIEYIFVGDGRYGLSCGFCILGLERW